MSSPSECVSSAWDIGPWWRQVRALPSLTSRSRKSSPASSLTNRSRVLPTARKFSIAFRTRIRAGKANISDTFARIEKGEAFLYNADIQPYEKASHEVPTAKRVRKLLLHRQEIDKLYGETQVAGRALVVLKLYWKSGKLKAELGVAQGKVARDKRADLKKRAIDRETAREVARFNRRHG